MIHVQSQTAPGCADDGLTQPLPIVEHLEAFKHRPLRLRSRLELLFMHQLIHERTEEAFDHGIVIVGTFATHVGISLGCTSRR